MSGELGPEQPVKRFQINPRVVPAIIVSAIVLAAIYAGNWFWLSFVLMGFGIAYSELNKLMRTREIHPSRIMVIGISLMCYFLAYWGFERYFQIIITTGVMLTFIWFLFRKSRATISDIGATILMFFYLGYLPAHYVLLRQIEPQGLGFLLVAIFAIGFSDIGAYYGGKLIGKNLLSPQISPKKTIEGFIVGIITGCIAASVVAYCFGIGWYHGVILGLVLPLVGMWGDLFESLLKRDAGLKDIGTLIPGHGGVLDRTDSYIFAAPVVYYYVFWGVLHKGLAFEVLTWLGSYPLKF